MTAKELETTIITQNAKPDCTINITKIEASDSVQSHLSTSTSSKRPIRIPSSNPPDATGVNSSLDPISAQSGCLSLLQWLVASIRHLTSPASPILPTTGRMPTHLDRSCTRTVTKWALVLYCFVSCMVTGFRIYAGVFGPKGQGGNAVKDFPKSVSPPGNTKSISQYLTRPISPAVLEPFVVSGINRSTNVTICAWLQDTELNLLEGWMRSSAASLSLLITTTTPFSSPQHRKLLGTLRRQLTIPSAVEVSIHLLHVKQVDVKLPNLYLNLARLLAVGDWTLLMPGGPHNSSLTEQNSPVNFEAKLGAYLLSSGAHTYPFPDLSPLLIRKDSNFWCTGRFFPGGSRSLDWNECLWQLYLEMTGKIAIVDVAQSNGKADPTEGPLNPDGIIRQRLTARFRAERCDTFLKKISGLYPRTRHRNMEIEWARAFCAKTVDRKVGR